MRKHIFVAAPLAALFLSSFAQASADIAITGRVLPPACDLSLTLPHINYGHLAIDELNAAGNTAITPHMGGNKPVTTMNIVCDAPAQVAVSFTDNRAASVEDSVLDVLPGATTHSELFGLGQDNVSTRLGAYSIEGEGAQVDGVDGDLLASTDNGQTWSPAPSRRVQNTNGWIATWVKTGASTTSAEPVTTVSQIMEVNAAVISTASMDTSVPVVLDGSMTMELIYL